MKKNELGYLFVGLSLFLVLIVVVVALGLLPHKERSEPRECEPCKCETTTHLVKGEICYDGFDNDKDGFIDCDDPDCSYAATCRPLGDSCETRLSPPCQFGVVSEQNSRGMRRCVPTKDECYSQDDAEEAEQPGIENCSNGIDDDSDGWLDCLDNDCANAKFCQF